MYNARLVFFRSYSRFSSQIVILTQKAMCVHLVPELDFLQRFRFSYSYVIFTFISLSFSRKSRWEVQVMGQVFANWVLKLPWRHWFQRQLEYGFSSFFKPFLEYLISFQSSESHWRYLQQYFENLSNRPNIWLSAYSGKPKIRFWYLIHRYKIGTT